MCPDLVNPLINFLGIIFGIMALLYGGLPLLGVYLLFCLILWIFAPRISVGIAGTNFYESRWDEWRGKHWCSTGRMRR